MQKIAIVPQQISARFASWLRYCTDVVHRRPTKLHDVWPSVWAVTLYIHFWGLLSPNGILPRKIHFASRSCVILYCQRYCTALEQWALAKLRRGIFTQQGGRPVRH